MIPLGERFAAVGTELRELIRGGESSGCKGLNTSECRFHEIGRIVSVLLF